VLTCASCGNELPEGSRFCNACGAAVAEAPPSREQRKVVTVLFCDVTGSTALGERLDPESVRALLARYFEHMKTIVERHGGTVEKFIGDAVMAVFGVPTVHEDDALRALRAAGEMAEELPALGIEGRIGVMSGEVVTGTAERLATGDAVNVAARLQQAAAPGDVLLGEETYRLARAAVEVEAVAPLELKGKTKPVAAYRLVSVLSGEGIARRPDAPMVGRETELRRLRDAFDQAARDRSCQLFSILGAAGVGKSRLAAEFLASLDAARVTRGRCLPYGDGITYWPVVEVVKQLADVELEGAADVAIRSLLGETPSTVSTDEIAWGVRKLLEAAAALQPLVCVFDDAQWGEDTFHDLVEHVADLSREAPILLLCIARPELLDRRPAWSGGKLNSTTVLLEPLDESETERLIASLGELDDALRERIRDAAEGNPLFVEQMVALARESGGEVVVPPTIQALLAARIDQLAVPERSVLEAGSVEGRLFHRGAVAALAPDEPQVATRLTALVRKELVRPDKSQLPGEDAFRFRHLLIRDAAYDALPKSTRAELHARFAAWLEEHGPDLVELDEILGYHLERSYLYRTELGASEDATRPLADEARSRLSQAGRRALIRGDVAAVGLLERAVSLLPPSGHDANLELDLTDALFLAGRPTEIEHLMESLTRRAQRSGDRVAELRARLRAEEGRVFTDSRAGLDRLDAIVAEARPELEAADDPLGLYDLWVCVATAAHGRQHNEEKLEAIERAMACARTAGDARRATRLTPFLVNGRFFGPRPVVETLSWIEQQSDEGIQRQVLDVHRAQLVAMLGRFDEARAVLETARARVEERGMETPAAINRDITGRVEWIAGDVASAVRWARDACTRLETMGHLAWLSTSLGDLGRYLCELGEWDEADALAERSKELGAEDDIATQSIWRCVRALVLAERGDFANAERLGREAFALSATTDHIDFQAAVLADLAKVVELAGKSDEAVELLQQSLTLYERKGNVVMAARVRDRLVTQV
jgi:class 3 adenylate cyclase/tetratricopeptide (TPR) repeat protein